MNSEYGQNSSRENSDNRLFYFSWLSPTNFDLCYYPLYHTNLEKSTLVNRKQVIKCHISHLQTNKKSLPTA